MSSNWATSRRTPPARYEEEPTPCIKTLSTEVFTFLQNLGGDGSSYGEHMKDARFTIPTAQLLSRVVDMLDEHVGR